MSFLFLLAKSQIFFFFLALALYFCFLLLLVHCFSSVYVCVCVCHIEAQLIAAWPLSHRQSDGYRLKQLLPSLLGSLWLTHICKQATNLIQYGLKYTRTHKVSSFCLSQGTQSLPKDSPSPPLEQLANGLSSNFAAIHFLPLFLIARSLLAK